MKTNTCMRLARLLMSRRDAHRAKDIHDAGQRLVDTGTHVERLHREQAASIRITVSSRSGAGAQSCAADAGHSTITVPPRRHTLIRIVASVRI